MLRSSGSNYRENEDEIRTWVNSKLNLAAENHHNQNSPSYGEMSNIEKTNQATIQAVDGFFEAMDNQGGEIYEDDLLKLNNANTKFIINGRGKIEVQKWVNGSWTVKNEYDQNEKREVLRQVFAEELGMQSSQNYSSNIIQR